MHGFRRRAGTAALAAVLAALASAAQAQEGERPEAPAEARQAASADPADDLITMDFQDVDLPVLVKFISEITGRNFIIDERVKGKVTIISPSKITIDEAYQVFLSVLQVKNLTTVPAGAVTKIVPAQEAKSSTLPSVFPDETVGATDEMITRLMQLRNVDAGQIVSIIQPLISPNGLLATYAPSNTLIIIDSAANIERVSRIIHELDVAISEQGVEVIRLNYAFATEMAAILEQVLEEPQAAAPGPAARRTTRRTAARGTARRAQRRRTTTTQTTVAEGGTGERAFKIIPDERTNSLIVVAGPIEMRRIKELVVKLDVPLPLGTGRIHVYYLKYANAFEVVPVLADIVGGGGGGGLTSGLLSRAISGSAAFRGGRLGQRGSLSGFGDLGGLGGFGGLGSGSGFGSRAQALRRGTGSLARGTTGAAGGVTSATGGGGGEFEGEVRITADPSTNALIINASPRDFETLKRVIEMIDVRRRQVFVEAIIMEVRLTKERDLGIELQGATGLDKGAGLGRVNFGNLGAFNANPASLGLINGLVLAAASNQTVRLPDGTVVPAQTALLLASQSDTDVNILSAPTILTTDNQEAEIVVGQNVPFIASRSTSDVNLANTFATVDRRDVGITLRITPQISEGGMVRLDIFQEVSALIPSAVSGLDPNLVGPSTTIRSATTTVVVRDNQTVVIGGLISDDITNAESKVPFFGDLPVLGNLFKATSADRSKIHLLIFLTPHIIRDAADHRALSLERRDQLRAFMEEHDFPNKRREYLERPSWTPELPEDREKEDEEAATSQEEAAPEQMARRPDLEAPPQAAAPSVPEPAARFVLLARLSDNGAVPPESLQSESGLIALEIDPESRLTSLFRKGRTYRFQSDTYEATFHCLEAYGTAAAALLVYPEGLPVDPSTGERLHWRELKDAWSANVTAWSEAQ